LRGYEAEEESAGSRKARVGREDRVSVQMIV